MMELYLHSPIYLHGLMGGSLSTATDLPVTFTDNIVKQTTNHRNFMSETRCKKNAMFLCLVKHHAMKMYEEWRFVPPCLSSALDGEWSASSPGHFTPPRFELRPARS
jgi:hypothetical protein